MGLDLENGANPVSESTLSASSPHVLLKVPIRVLTGVRVFRLWSSLEVTVEALGGMGKVVAEEELLWEIGGR